MFPCLRAYACSSRSAAVREHELLRAGYGIPAPRPDEDREQARSAALLGENPGNRADPHPEGGEEGGPAPRRREEGARHRGRRLMARRKVAKKARALTDELGLTTPRSAKRRTPTKP